MIAHPHRFDGRLAEQLRPVSIEPNVQLHAEGSCIVSFGDTKVLCAASIEERVPEWLAGKGKGWVTAEYGMLPRSTHTRMRRDKNSNGRAQEIQRLIGRSLRAVTDLQALGETMITVDCDVLQADGGTRTAAITGGFVALALALRHLAESRPAPFRPLRDYVAAVSAGWVGGQALLDLCYTEDSSAHVDMNLVGTRDGRLVEVQMTGEEAPVEVAVFRQLEALCLRGVGVLTDYQREVVPNLDTFFDHHRQGG